MISIPIEFVILFGGLAVIREIKEVFFSRNYKNFGEMFAYLWTFIIYLVIYNPPEGFSAHPFIRVGIMLIFLDKSIIFISEIYPSLLKKIKKIFRISEG
jgi:hypothetical protein